MKGSGGFFLSRSRSYPYSAYYLLSSYVARQLAQSGLLNSSGVRSHPCRPQRLGLFQTCAQIHKPSDNCSLHFPNDVPMFPHPHLFSLFFSCKHVCFYRRGVTSSQLASPSLPLAAAVIHSLSCCSQGLVFLFAFCSEVAGCVRWRQRPLRV